MIKRLLIIIPVVLALTLVSLFVPAQLVNIEGIGTLSVGQEVTNAGKQAIRL